ncbi:hypothetical protein [Marinimicrobium sp. ABcell2]|uniref:hypothetical protein n=1 Tax=Marinimicrobium sp. ABcell2 TaxID=3069751 RepID=UPI0027B6DE9D|nr:hypothetical protein [Marinimicrobium sp. ABcell2]MDQ2077557.1 hypothetical protein [Marinimicrobium sp. ABcell2]
MSLETAVFYLYISVTGIAGGEDMHVNIGRYESQSSCEAVGAQTVRKMREEARETEIDGLENTEFSYRCSENAPRGA